MFLLDRFQDFYREVLRLKQSVGQGNWVFDGQAQPGQPPVEDLSPTAVWRTLLSLLERQALEASRSGGDFALEVYRRSQYAMAALADEVFLISTGPGARPGGRTCWSPACSARTARARSFSSASRSCSTTATTSTPSSPASI